METSSAVDFELAAQRENVAAFIQNRLQPVGQILTKPDEEAAFEVRDYQLDAWQALWEAREQGEMSALVTLATGLGKTSVGVFDVIKFREELREQEDRDPKVLFVCHQDRILEQAAKRFNRFVPDLSQGYYTGIEKDTEQDITFATFQSLEKNLDKFDSFEYDYIIYDEAHHSQADTWHRVVKHFNPTFQLALTATPDRMDGLEIKDLFGREVYAKGLGEALAEGLLADIDYHIVFDEAVKDALDAGFHPKNLKEMKELLAVPRRNEVIAKNIREEMENIGAKDAKTIVFCNDIPHAQVMAKLLGGKAYHSEMKRKERGEVLDDFRDGDLQIICVRDMFNEGIDIPDANLLVFLRSTQSKTVFEQQLGRGLRKTKDKDQVSVLDFVGNVKRLQEILDLSNAISALTSEAELDQIVVDGDRPREGGSFKVSTSHTNFDFDKMAVDILSTYQSLIFEQAPEGYVSVDAFARELGTTYSTLKELIAHHQIETGRHQFHTSVGTSLSPEAQEYIRGLGGFVDPAPEGYLSAHQFAKEFGTTAPYLMKALKDYKIPVGRHRFGTITTISFSPEAQQMVRENVAFVQPAPEGYASMNAFAKELGISEHYLTRSLGEHGIETESHRFGQQIGRSLSPEAQERIKALDLQGEPMPEGYASMSAFAKELGTQYQVLAKRVKELGIQPSRHRAGQGFAYTLSPEDRSMVRNTYYPDLEQTPEGYVTINNFRDTSGLGHSVLRRLMAESGIEAIQMKFAGNRVAGMLSPEAQAKLRELGKDFIAEPAPEGYVSINTFAKEIKTAQSTLLQTIEEHGVEMGRHRFRSQTTNSLSPEAQARLRDIYNQGVSLAPEGHVSVAAYAKDMGIAAKTLFRLIESHGVDTEEHRFGLNTVGASLSPEAQAQVRQIHESQAPLPPEGFKSVDGFAREIGSHWSVLKKLIAQNEIETSQYRGKTGGVGEYLTPEDQERITGLVQDYEVADAPEDYMSTTSFAEAHGISRTTLRRVMERGGIEAPTYKFGSYRAGGLSPDAQEKLSSLVSELVAEPAPEGYVSVGGFARTINAAKSTVEEIIKELGIETARYRFGVNASDGLSPEAQQQIRELRANS